MLFPLTCGSAGLSALGALALFAFLLLLWRKARRLDQLHGRVQARQAGLNRHLIKRCAETLRTADLPSVPKDRAAQLRRAATDALALADAGLATTGMGSRAKYRGAAAKRLEAESALSEALELNLDEQLRSSLAEDPVAAAQLAALDEASRRVRLVKALHNQDAAFTIKLRRHWLVRVFHLAGKAKMPAEIIFDDGGGLP